MTVWHYGLGDYSVLTAKFVYDIFITWGQKNSWWLLVCLLYVEEVLFQQCLFQAIESVFCQQLLLRSLSQQIKVLEYTCSLPVPARYQIIGHLNWLDKLITLKHSHPLPNEIHHPFHLIHTRLLHQRCLLLPQCIQQLTITVYHNLRPTAYILIAVFNSRMTLPDSDIIVIVTIVAATA